MKITMRSLRGAILEKISEEELVKRIDLEIKASGGLIDSDVAEKLVASRLGISVKKYCGEEIIVNGIVIYSNLEDMPGKIVIHDKRIVCLIIWEGIEKVDINEGEKVKISVKYQRVRETSTGINIYISHGEMIDIESREKSSKEFKKISEINDGDVVNASGIIVQSKNIKTFKRKEGKEGRLKILRIYDGSAECKVVLWDKHAEDRTWLKEGKEVCLKNFIAKKKNGEMELHSKYFSYIIPL